METSAERNNRRSPGRGARDFYRVLNRLGASRKDDGLLWRRPWRQLVQPLSKPHINFIRSDLETGVGEGFELIAHRGEDARMPVPDVLHRDAAGEIDIAASLDVPYLGIFGARGEQRRSNRNSARDRGGQPGGEFLIGIHDALVLDRAAKSNR